MNPAIRIFLMGSVGGSQSEFNCNQCSTASVLRDEQSKPLYYICPYARPSPRGDDREDSIMHIDCCPCCIRPGYWPTVQQSRSPNEGKRRAHHPCSGKRLC